MIFGILSLICKAFTQTATKAAPGIHYIVGVIAVGFSSKKNVQSVMNVVIPLSVVETDSATLITLKVPGDIVDVFEDEVDESLFSEAISDGSG